MNSCYLMISPIDTLFFREIRPFNMQDLILDNIESIFPPTAFSLTGLIRNGIANTLGWEGKQWNNDIKKLLGNYLDLGSLNFFGPYLIKEEKNDINILYPIPRILYGNTKINKFTYMTPDKTVPYLTNSSKEINQIFLCKPKENVIDGRLINNYFIDKKNLLALLNRKDLNETNIFSKQQAISDNNNLIWQQERQFGIKLTFPNKSTSNDDNSLFSRTFIRLQSNFHLLMQIDGLNDDTISKVDSFITRIGGEGKFGEVKQIHNQKDQLNHPRITELDDSNGRVKFSISFITPANLGNSFDSVKIFLEEKLNSDLITASVGKTIRVGGWNSKTKEPMKAEPYIPIGSTYFFETEQNQEFILQKNFNKLGKYTEFGFGQFIIGKW